MNKNDSNPNIEWKKSGFEQNDRPSLKIDVKKAIEHDVKNKTNVQKAYVPNPSSFPAGLNKIRKKIKEAYDDDDEDEDEKDYQTAANSPDFDSSLLNALSEDEKSILQQQEETQRNKLLENTNKLAAVNNVNKFIKEAELIDINKERTLINIQNDNSSNKDVAFNAVKKNLKKETGMKIRHKIKDKDLKNIAKGIKKIKKIAGKEILKDMDIRAVTKIGKEDLKDRETAKIILEKSGVKEVKKEPEKTITKMKIGEKDKKYVEKKLAEEKKIKKEKLNR